jgi:rhodanese-related sulfurtransferase
MVQSITREELRTKLAAPKGPIMIDALPDKDFRQGHLPKAVNMPHDRVETLAPKMLADKKAEIVVYSADAQCDKSRIAADRLTKLGYENVWVYAGGKKDWKEGGMQFEPTAKAA